MEAQTADRSGCKVSRKIIASLDQPAPLRSSQTPYLLHKHDEVGESVFARPAVVGLGNCKACHPGAEQGYYYYYDHLSIPR